MSKPATPDLNVDLPRPCWSNSQAQSMKFWKILSPVALLRLYLGQLWIHLSIIRLVDHQPTSTSSTTINQTYLGTFFAFTIAVLQGTLGLHLEAGLPLQGNFLKRTPFIFWRQFTYWPIWPQMDISMTVATVGLALVLLDFAFKRPIPDKYLFTINRSNPGMVQLDGKDLITYESAQIAAIFTRARHTHKFFACSLYIFAMFFCNGAVFFVTKVYLVSFGSITFWLLGFPFIILLLVLFFIANLVHIIVSGSCITIRQQFLCLQLDRLLRHLTTKGASRRRLRRLFPPIWYRYLTLNAGVLSICKQLVAFNHFWTAYLTEIFLKYTIIQVVLTYAIFFTPTEQTALLILKSIIFFGIIETIILIFGLIEFCARVVKRNGAIGRLNRQFAVHCFRHQGDYKLQLRQLLKIEIFQWSRLLHGYAFKLFGNSRITSKTFYAVWDTSSPVASLLTFPFPAPLQMAINISGLFLFVMKRMQ